ncbi:MAG TPA: CheR family methyltransferase [Polyangiaceae bacterium]|nr:CheR family methyltransferase [Polyangiaceae bacterium]
MMSPSVNDDVLRFRSAIKQRFGLRFDDARLEFLASLLARRAAACGRPPSLYVDGIEQAASIEGELDALAQELTVPETYFFRHAEQLQVFSRVALPDRLNARVHAKQLQILSAGCASGEEAYSLAMLTREQVTDPRWKVTIRGVDMNRAVLKRAWLARYSSWSLRETPPEMQRRYFRSEGRDFVVNAAIRELVTFEETNLAFDDPALFAGETFDIIFCRNVLMYFASDVAARVLERMATSLVQGGYLFLGHAETLRGLSPGGSVESSSDELLLRNSHGTFYYQRGPRDAAARHRVAPSSLPAPISRGRESGSITWFDDVRRSFDRIESLTKEPPRVARQSDPNEVMRPADKRESFRTALAHLEGGRFHEARAYAQELVGLDPDNACAHYLLALAAEGLGESTVSEACDEAAARLDPAFALPHLHLGLMAHRAGNLDKAKLELARAIWLMEGEDEKRLELFGGGFSRDNLVALCRATIDSMRGVR